VTAIVGIRCKDGVVIGADSSATFGDGEARGVIEQSTSRKIEIIGESVIVAGTGAVGHVQRFSPVIQGLWNQKAFQGKTDIEIGKMLSSGTHPAAEAALPSEARC
jgi:20S proteasome alpha/beta subunit